jgi:RHS repeat-associated protein
LTQDHLGSPRIITDNVGKVIARKDFSAFGDETNSAQRTELLGYKPEEIRQDYTGYQKDDESGLEFAQARYYNTKHGRFTSVDPLTASANVKDPQTFNRYSYGLNSPYKFTDPLGLVSKPARSLVDPSTLTNDAQMAPAGGIDPIVTGGRANSTPASAQATDPPGSTHIDPGPVAAPGRRDASSDPTGPIVRSPRTPPIIDAFFSTGQVFDTEHPRGNQLLPPGISDQTVTDVFIERRWNVGVTLNLKDTEGNDFNNYEYEVSYDNKDNPKPSLGVEGRQSTENGQASLGLFTIKSVSVSPDPAQYNADRNLPSNASLQTSGTVKIFGPNGNTAEIKFNISAGGDKSPSVTPETTRLKWVKPK